MTRPRLQVAFITGRSRKDNWALSPQQQIFIQSITDDGVHAVVRNFPWTPQTQVWQDSGIVRASISNMREYLGSRRQLFALRYRDVALQMLAGAEQTLLLAGSCGLELFNNLQLPVSVMPRIAIFAYGPVARRRPYCRHLLVQGRSDVISRCWFPAADKHINSDHMNYLTQPELMALCRAFIADIDGERG